MSDRARRPQARRKCMNVRPLGFSPPRSVGSALVALVAAGCLCATADATPAGKAPEIGVGNSPDAVAIDLSTHTAYVANDGAGSVSVINAGRVTATIAVGNQPHALAVDSATHSVYVANYGGRGSVSVINAGRVTATIPVGLNPYGVAVDPLTHTAFVVNSGSHSVSVINGGVVTATIPVGYNPIGVAVDPSTHAVYVANNATGTVSVIKGGAVTATIKVGTRPFAVALDTSTPQVYVTNAGSGTVSMINGGAVTATTVGFGTPEGVAVDQTSHVAYISEETLNDVAGLSSNRIAGRTAVGTAPLGLAVDPSTHGIYVANLDSASVSVFTAPGAKLRDLSVGLGSKPTGLLYDPTRNAIFAALSGVNRVDEIASASTCATQFLCNAPAAAGFGTNLNAPESLATFGTNVLATNSNAPAGDAVSDSNGARHAVPGCVNATGIAVLGSELWVTCPGSGLLAELPVAGGPAVVGTLPVPGASPGGLVADPTTPGAVIVADVKNDELYIYTRPGATPSPAQTLHLDGGCAPAGLATFQVSPGAGQVSLVYVACPGRSDVQLVTISAAGTFLGKTSFKSSQPVPTRDVGIVVQGSTLVVTGSGSDDAYIYTLRPGDGLPESDGTVHVVGLPRGSAPNGVAIAGNEVYIADEGTGQISIINR